MADDRKFGKDDLLKGSPGPASTPQDCERCEALLVDLLDGTLTDADRLFFETHSAGCASCGELREQARRGQEWMKLLDHAPEAPADLLPKILAKTQGQQPGFESGLPQPAGFFVPGAMIAAQRGFRDARLLMTAAMAFFSIALTMSVAGVRLTSVHAAELRPQSVQASMTRSFYGTKKQVVNFYDNLRLVYEVESKMHELRGDSDTPSSTPAPDQQKPQPKTDGQGGRSRLDGGLAPRPAPSKGTDVDKNAARSNKRPAVPVEHGFPVLASNELPAVGPAIDLDERLALAGVFTGHRPEQDSIDTTERSRT